MKKTFIATISIVFLVSIGAMLALHWREAASLQSSLLQKDLQISRVEKAQTLIFELEQFRAVNANFRRMLNAEIANAKKSIANSLREGIESLEGEGASAEDRASLTEMRIKFSELQILSAKLEPLLYTRNAYQNSDIQQMHADILRNIQQVRTNARAQGDSAYSAALANVSRTRTVLAQAAGVAVTMYLSLFLYLLFSHARPLQLLRERVKGTRSGFAVADSARLRGVYGEIEWLIRDLIKTIESHRKDRLEFVTAVASDLKPPLLAVRASTDVIASAPDRLVADPHLRFRTVESSRNAVFRLTAVLDGLNDILDSNEGRLRLNEQITDLNQLILATARVLDRGESGDCKVQASVPPIPVWATIDRERLEHVIVYIVSKLLTQQEQPGRIVIEMSAGDPQSKGGLHLSIYDQGKGQNQVPQSTQNVNPLTSGPDQGLLRHWATQKGFGMSMADRIMRAHGGNVTAAGVAGTRLVFRLWLPPERISIGLLQSDVSGFQDSINVNATPSMHPRN
ncbi:MAG: hypothetical protein A2Z97_09195 [Bdellovibrionales bacterium GWB1_52_6]|nr:MAG: hypothetical protein A2Z97_09195 [Bdellovibrionales bacterium GWB1_52_6]OFZ05416.1 MAG: hypothetical protein A2X97_11080 [Bdellovibrionales bacterium GWA1_52_35]HCM39223.1 hypothetical protein [Bdellovibrionales bacterium]